MQPYDYLKILISSFFLLSSVSCSDDQTSFTTTSESLDQRQEANEGKVGEGDAVSAVLPENDEDTVRSNGEDLSESDDNDLENLTDNTENLEDNSEASMNNPAQNEDSDLDEMDSTPVDDNIDGTTSLSEPKTIEEEVKEVQALCTNSKGMASMKEYIQEVSFEEVKDCSWGLDGNEPLDNINNTFQVARVDQMYQLDFALSKNTQICSMDINVPMQDMLFDDHMLLTLNDYVVTSSVDFTIPKLNTNALPVEDGLTKYSWKDFKGMPFSGGIFNNVKPYCVGIEASKLSAAEYKKVCDIPVTDTFGSMTIDVPEATATKMAIKIKDKSAEEAKLRFNLITTGDNDRYDCKHKPFKFSIKVKYLD